MLWHPYRRKLLPMHLLLLMLHVGACSDSGPQTVQDPIVEIPTDQQRTITRSDLPGQWPFTVGRGTLGCKAQAVMFRTDGRTYALNDAATVSGFASVEPIRAV